MRNVLVRAAATAALLALHGCDLGDDPAPPSLEPYRSFEISSSVGALAGHGDLLAVHADGGRGVVHFYRQDASDPDVLLDLGEAPVASGYPFEDLEVTEDWVAAVSGGTVTLFSRGPAGPAWSASFQLFSEGRTRAVASGRWLLVSSGSSLRLRDLASPDAPEIASFDAGAPVTGIVDSQAGFLVFTAAGLGIVDASTGVPAYALDGSSELRLLDKAYRHGSKVYAGGPSPFAGRTRVARIDVSSHAFATLEAAADVDGVYEDFAYDGAGTFVVATKTPDHGTQRGVVLHEDGGRIVAAFTADLHGLFRSGVSTLHASSKRLHAITALPMSTNVSHLSTSRLP